jgi:hypothetical protein
MRTPVALVVVLLLAGPAHALTIEENSDGTQRTLLDYIEDYIDVPEGAIDWKLFGTTKEIDIQTKTADGYDLEYFKPEFQPDVMALDGTEITIKGFMFPLDETDDQKLFLLGPFPMSCPYHYHVGPALVIEVHADENPVRFDYEPVVIRGRLELVPEDPEYSTFYRLIDARKAN